MKLMLRKAKLKRDRRYLQEVNMELWIWLGGLLLTVATVGGIFWYSGRER